MGWEEVEVSSERVIDRRTLVGKHYAGMTIRSVRVEEGDEVEGKGKGEVGVEVVKEEELVECFGRDVPRLECGLMKSYRDILDQVGEERIEAERKRAESESRGRIELQHAAADMQQTIMVMEQQ